MYRLLNVKPVIFFYAENKYISKNLLKKQIHQNNLYIYITKYI